MANRLEIPLARFVSLTDDRGYTASIAVPCPAADGLFELLQAFFDRPAGTLFEPVPKKGKAICALIGIHRAGLARIQAQPSLLNQVRDLLPAWTDPS